MTLLQSFAFRGSLLPAMPISPAALLLTPGAGWIMKDGRCVVDCPMPLSQALEMAGIVLGLTVLAALLRRSRWTLAVLTGNALILGAASLLFTIEWAGRHWGIIRTHDPIEFYEPNLISVCVVALAAVAAAGLYALRRAPAVQA